MSLVRDLLKKEYYSSLINSLSAFNRITLCVVFGYIEVLTEAVYTYIYNRVIT